MISLGRRLNKTCKAIFVNKYYLLHQIFFRKITIVLVLPKQYGKTFSFLLMFRSAVEQCGLRRTVNLVLICSDVVGYMLPNRIQASGILTAHKLE